MHEQEIQSRPAVFRYGLAAAAVAVAVLLKLGLDRLVQVNSPFLLCFGAVLISAYVGGLGPGLLATLLSAAAAEFLWHRQGLGGWTGQNTRAAVFAVEGILISVICALLHAARGRASASAAEAHSSAARADAAAEALRDSQQKAKALDESLKQSQGELLRWSHRERRMVEEVKDYAIFFCTPENLVATWNEGAARIFGYTEEEIIGKSARILFTTEDQAKGEPEKEMGTAAREGRASDDRWQMRKDGSRFYASGVTTGLRDEAGTLIGFTKVCRDLTERQLHEEERERLLKAELVARRAADAANRMKDEFLAVVSHELRTPLTAILLWARLLRQTRPDAEELSEGLATIEQSAKAQQQLIEDLLDVSRIMSGKLRIEVRETALAPAVQAAVDAIRPMADAKGLSVETSLDSSAGIVRVDPDRVQQVVWNLLTNSVKFTPRGGVVGVRMERFDGRVRIVVSDTGRGIAPEFLPHVFDRFRQGDAGATRYQGGLGLGLTIARQLVELHGGTIHAESAGEGKGASFVMELPVADVTAAVTGPGRQAPLATGGGVPFRPAPVLRGVRVLLAEDETSTRRAIQWLLEQCGADVVPTSSADEALAAVHSADGFDVIVSDIAMPGKDGYEMLRDVRAHEAARGAARPTPAIALTAYAREEDRLRALDAGYQMHQPKPVEPGDLVATMLRVLGRTDTGA